jgi:hypothetical protein
MSIDSWASRTPIPLVPGSILFVCGLRLLHLYVSVKVDARTALQGISSITAHLLHPYVSLQSVPMQLDSQVLFSSIPQVSLTLNGISFPVSLSEVQ